MLVIPAGMTISNDNNPHIDPDMAQLTGLRDAAVIVHYQF